LDEKLDQVYSLRQPDFFHKGASLLKNKTKGGRHKPVLGCLEAFVRQYKATNLFRK
jgi:hypothetical protein